MKSKYLNNPISEYQNQHLNQILIRICRIIWIYEFTIYVTNNINYFFIYRKIN